MKNSNTPKARMRALIFLLMMFVCSASFYSQTDTLHLYYNQVQTTLHDTSLAKIDKWVKKLNGKHQDITVVAYYSKVEFRKYSQQRADELFLILNRKARALITIKFIGPKKGENSQRSTADIIYSPTVNEADVKAAAAKAEADKLAKKEAEKSKKESEKPKKDGDKGGKETAKEEKSEKSKSEVAAEQTEKKGKDKKGSDDKKSGDKEEEEEEQDEADYGQASSRTINDGYAMTLDELKYVKSAKLVVAQTGNKTIDGNLFRAVKDFWNFNSNIVQMPYDEARKLGKENKKDTMGIISFIQVKTWFKEKHGPLTIRVLRVGYAIALENGKGKLLVKQIIPKKKGQAPTLIDFVFAVSFLNNMCHIMDEHQLSKSTKADEYFDLRASELKTKTLYVAEHQIHPNLPHKDIPEYYTSPLNLVTDKMWEEAILGKKDVAYVMIVNLPISPKRMMHYIMDAKTGGTYLIDAGMKVQFNAGFGASFDPNQSGLIDKPNFIRYEKGINKAIEDTKERADDKAKDAEKAKAKAAKDEAKKAAKEEKEKEKAVKEKDGEKKKDKSDDSDSEKKEKPKKEKKSKKSEEASTDTTGGK